MPMVIESPLLESLPPPSRAPLPDPSSGDAPVAPNSRGESVVPNSGIVLQDEASDDEKEEALEGEEDIGLDPEVRADIIGHSESAFAGQEHLSGLIAEVTKYGDDARVREEAALKIARERYQKKLADRSALRAKF